LNKTRLLVYHLDVYILAVTLARLVSSISSSSHFV